MTSYIVLDSICSELPQVIKLGVLPKDLNPKAQGAW